ncbi:unnamed protein product [Penicillium salamii]|uniref:Uncharacterized protein n=1 Tax=Penicillium salamii TaxID=1612424 RepID=A0A9W4IW63_9EURO|nr:unnamed protein product [Penicillium salamii]
MYGWMLYASKALIVRSLMHKSIACISYTSYNDTIQSISITSTTLEVVFFSLTIDRALFFELVCFANDLLFNGFDIPLSLVEALKPLPPKLPSLVMIVVIVDDARALCPTS